MKTSLFVLISITYAFGNVTAQIQNIDAAKGEINLGLEVFQSLPSYILNSKYFIQKTVVIEPIIRIQTNRSRKTLVISPGFTSGSTNKNKKEFISYEKFQGYYIKLGYETRNRGLPMSIGFGPIISFASFKGKYKFEGPAFGDYEGDFRDKDNIAAGINGYVTYDVNFNERLSLRVLLQGSITARKGIINPYYYPGLGFTKGNGQMMFSPGITTQLFFKVR